MFFSKSNRAPNKDVPELITCSNELDHFNAAAFALSNFWHVSSVDGVVERVVAPGVVPAVALKTLNGPTP